MKIRNYLVQAIGRLRMIERGILPQGEPTEVDRHLLTAYDAGELTRRVGVIDRILSYTNIDLEQAMEGVI